MHTGRLLSVGGFLIALSASASVAQTFPPAQTVPIDATIATIAIDPPRSGMGIQGISLNVDRSLIYVAQGTRTTQWNGERCAPTPPPQAGTAGAISVIDTNLLAKRTDLPLEAGFPIHVELDVSTGRMYVAASPDWVYAFEGTRQVAAARLGGVPHDVGIDSTNGRGIVTNTNAITGVQTHVALIDLGTLQVLRHIDTGGFGPHKAASDSERHLVYVSHAEFDKVDVIDTTTGDLLRQITTGLGRGGAQNAIDTARRRLYVTGAAPSGTTAALVAIDLNTERPIGEPIPLPFGGHGMRVDPDTGLIWVVLEEQGQIAVFDPETLTERARIATGHCPYYLDIDPVLRRAYVNNQGDNTISVIDMTRIAGPTALTVLNRLAARARSNDANAVRALADGVLDYVRVPRAAADESIRQRLARAEENFRLGWHHPISEETILEAASARSAVVELAQLREIRRRLQATAPHLAEDASGMSPAEALLVTVSLTGGRLSLDHDLLTALGIRR
jgi:DNA-binding beta-propeller fold protein YncE